MFISLLPEIFHIFLSPLESILNQLYTNSINIIIRGDINYHANTNNKFQLDSLLASYDLYSTVKPRSIVPATIVFPHVLFAIFGPELSSI